MVHCHQHLGMQERHRPVVPWFPHCMQVTQVVFAHLVSTGLCTVTTLPEVTHADRCELSFFSKRKAGPENGSEKMCRLSEYPRALGSLGPPSCRAGWLCFFCSQPQPQEPWEHTKSLVQHTNWCFLQGFISGDHLLFCLTPMVPQVLWNSFLDTDFPSQLPRPDVQNFGLNRSAFVWALQWNEISTYLPSWEAHCKA